MSEIDDFATTPTVEAFDTFSKDQLVLLAEHYEVPLSSSDKRTKAVIKPLIREVLVKKELLPPALEPPPETPTSSLSFERQKELLLLQLDKSKQQLLEQQGLVEKSKLEREVALGKQELERKKMALESRWITLIEEGKMGSGIPDNSDDIDVTKNIKLLPKFEESKVDTFFNLFE